jgi:hypothetical protein
MDEGDYPAAHSMDTAFFAVDRDGHVGYFESGDAGAVPVTGEVEIGERDEVWRQVWRHVDGLRPHCEALLAQLAQLLPHCEARRDLAGYRHPGEEQRHVGDLGAGQAWCVGYLLFLKSLDPALRDEIAAGRGAEVPAVGVMAVQALGLSPDLIRRLHDEGQCLGCYYHYTPRGAVPDEPIRSAQSSWTIRRYIPSSLAEVPPSPASFGLFYYAPYYSTGMAWPYGRLEVPVRPVHIDQLPPVFRQQFMRLQLDCAFAERAYVQPVEHWPCTSYDPAFLSSDGRKIGRARDVCGEHHWQPYAEFYAHRTGFGEPWLRTVEIEPPAGTD